MKSKLENFDFLRDWQFCNLELYFKLPEKCQEGLTRYFNWYKDFSLVHGVTCCWIRKMVSPPFYNNSLKGDFQYGF